MGRHVPLCSGESCTRYNILLLLLVLPLIFVRKGVEKGSEVDGFGEGEGEGRGAWDVFGVVA